MKKKFMDKALAGEIKDLNVAIDEAICEWHTEPDDGTIGNAIHIFLGMTWQEYARWVEKPSELKNIIEARRKINLN